MAQMTLAEAVFQLLRRRNEHMLDKLACGVKDWDAYQRVLGNLDALSWVDQELKSLLDKQEQNDE
jgi:hypothetical protein